MLSGTKNFSRTKHLVSSVGPTVISMLAVAVIKVTNCCSDLHEIHRGSLFDPQ